ncbi:MAG: hypothetical protein EKK45_23650 [Curvibacter sp.]|nr:MAG: hypothetical protein EKK45_23650 [Curvibacter sp.]
MKRTDAAGISGRLLRYACEAKLFRTRLREFVQRCLEGRLPAVWRRVVVRPLQKPGRPQGLVSSLRPVSDIPVMRALVEKVWAARAESTFSASPQQFGFRKGYSDDMVTTSLIRFVEAAQELRVRPTRVSGWRSHRVLIVALDIKDAYPGMHPLRLIEALGRADGGLAAWAAAVTCSKSLEVRHGGLRSAWRELPAGSSTGTADAPLQWRVFFDVLLARIREVAESRTRHHKDVKIFAAAVADDLTLAFSGPSAEGMAAAAAAVLSAVTSWCAESNLRISSKSSALLVKPHCSHNAGVDPRREWADKHGTPLPPLRCGGVEVQVKEGYETVKILGVLWDGFARFTQHFAEAQRKVARLMEPLRILRKWMPPWQMRRLLIAGPQAVTRHHLHAILGSKGVDMDAFEAVERMWTDAARMVCGAVANARGTTCVIEAGLVPLKLLATTVGCRRALEMRALAQTAATEKDREVCAQAQHQMAMIGMAGVMRSMPPTEPGVARMRPHEVVAAELITVKPLPLVDVAVEDDNAAERAAANAMMYASLDKCPVMAWSDGSYSPPGGGNAERAGAGVLVKKNGVEIYRGSEGVPVPACSFSAEAAAMIALLTAIISLVEAGEVQHGTTAAVFSDSQGLLLALERGPLRQRLALGRTIWGLLLTMAAKGIRVTLAFIFSHVGDADSDEVDQLAKDGLDVRAIGAPRILDVVREVRQAAVADFVEKECAGALREKYGIERKPSGFPLKVWHGMAAHNARLLLQLRTGACPAVGGHLHNIDDRCPHCGVIMRRGEGSACEHVFECTATEPVALRTRFAVEGFADVWAAPRRALQYLLGWIPESESDDETSSDDGDEVD